MRYWVQIVVAVVCLVSFEARAELRSFDEIRKNPSLANAQKSEEFHDFGPHRDREHKDMPYVTMENSCIFSHDTDPGRDIEAPEGAKKYIVSTPDDILKECEKIPDNACKGGVALAGHARYNMGTGDLLYLDSTSSEDNPVFYPPQKEKRQALITCFKRISRGLREGKQPLTFLSCTHPYADNPKLWDKYSHLLAKDLGVTVRTARGDEWTWYKQRYGIAHYGWSWSTPDDPQVYCEDGVRWKCEHRNH